MEPPPARRLDQPVLSRRFAHRPDLRPQPVAHQRRESIAANNVQMVANPDPIQQRNESVAIGVQVDFPQPVERRRESKLNLQILTQIMKFGAFVDDVTIIFA